MQSSNTGLPSIPSGSLPSLPPLPSQTSSTSGTPTAPETKKGTGPQQPKGTGGPRVEEETPQEEQPVEERKFIKQQVDIQGKKYNISVGYNEKALSEKYGVQGSALEETIKKIVVNLKPQDILALSGAKVAQAHLQGDKSFVKYQGERTVPLSQLKSEQPALAGAIGNISKAFEKSAVQRLITESQVERHSVFDSPQSSSTSSSPPLTRPPQGKLPPPPKPFTPTAEQLERGRNMPRTDPSKLPPPTLPPEPRGGPETAPREPPENTGERSTTTETPKTPKKMQPPPTLTTPPLSQPPSPRSSSLPPSTPLNTGERSTTPEPPKKMQPPPSLTTPPPQQPHRQRSSSLPPPSFSNPPQPREIRSSSEPSVGLPMQRRGLPPLPSPPPKLELAPEHAEQLEKWQQAETQSPPRDPQVSLVSTGKKTETVSTEPRVVSSETRRPSLPQGTNPMGSPRRISDAMLKHPLQFSRAIQMEIQNDLHLARSAKSPSEAAKFLGKAHEKLSELGELHLHSPDHEEIGKSFKAQQAKVEQAFTELSQMNKKEKAIAESLLYATKGEPTLGQTDDFPEPVRNGMKAAIDASELSPQQKAQLKDYMDNPKNLTPSGLKLLMKTAEGAPKEVRNQLKESVKDKQVRLKANEASWKESVQEVRKLKPEVAKDILAKVLCDQLRDNPSFDSEAAQKMIDNASVHNPRAGAALNDDAITQLKSKTETKQQLLEAYGKAEASIKNFLKFKKVHEDYEKQIAAGTVRMDVSQAKNDFERTSLIPKNIVTRETYRQQYEEAERALHSNLTALKTLADRGTGTQQNLKVREMTSLLSDITTREDGVQIAANFVESLKTVDELNANVSSNFGTAFGAGAPPYISQVDLGPISNTLSALQAKDETNSALYQQLNGLLGAAKSAMEPGIAALKSCYEDQDGAKVPKQGIKRTPEITQTIDTMKKEMTRLKEEAEKMEFPKRNPSDPLSHSDVGNTTKEFFISTCEGTLKKLAALEKNLVD